MLVTIPAKGSCIFVLRVHFAAPERAAERPWWYRSTLPGKYTCLFTQLKAKPRDSGSPDQTLWLSTLKDLSVNFWRPAKISVVCRSSGELVSYKFPHAVLVQVGSGDPRWYGSDRVVRTNADAKFVALVSVGTAAGVDQDESIIVIVYKPGVKIEKPEMKITSTGNEDHVNEK